MIASSEYFVFANAFPDISFRETSAGFVRRLECEECADIWCQHLHYIMTSNFDAEFVWHGVENWETKAVHIPMFPTQNQWAIAVLQKLETGYAKLLIEVDEATESIPISYLHPGEGRNVIRTTFIDYMLGHREADRKLQCNSPSHKFGQEQAWKRNTGEKSKLRAAEFWSVWQNNSCLSCHNNSTVLSEFESDLIPDDDRRRPWK